MSDVQKCEKTTFKGWRNIQCKHAAKVERDGKHYCNVHDPVRRKERQAARNAEIDRQYELRVAARKAAEAERAEVERRAAAYDDMQAHIEAQAAEIAEWTAKAEAAEANARRWEARVQELEARHAE